MSRSHPTAHTPPLQEKVHSTSRRNKDPSPHTFSKRAALTAAVRQLPSNSSSSSSATTSNMSTPATTPNISSSSSSTSISTGKAFPNGTKPQTSVISNPERPKPAKSSSLFRLGRTAKPRSTSTSPKASVRIGAASSLFGFLSNKVVDDELQQIRASVKFLLAHRDQVLYEFVSETNKADRLQQEHKNAVEVRIRLEKALAAAQKALSEQYEIIDAAYEAASEAVKIEKETRKYDRSLLDILENLLPKLPCDDRLRKKFEEDREKDKKARINSNWKKSNWQKEEMKLAEKNQKGNSHGAMDDPLSRAKEAVQRLMSTPGMVMLHPTRRDLWKDSKPEHHTIHYQ